MDASPDVRVIGYADNIDDAREAMAKQEAFGIIYIPSDFDHRLNRRQQATVSVYCDMSLLLAYKAIYITAMSVTGDMNADVQMKSKGEPFAEVSIFNPARQDADEQRRIDLLGDERQENREKRRQQRPSGAEETVLRPNGRQRLRLMRLELRIRLDLVGIGADVGLGSFQLRQVGRGCGRLGLREERASDDQDKRQDLFH